MGREGLDSLGLAQGRGRAPPGPHAARTLRAIPAVGSSGPLIVGRCGCAAAQVERRRQQLDRFFNMVSMLTPEPKRVAACLTGGWGVGSS